jgi:hypothetical protein
MIPNPQPKEIKPKQPNSNIANGMNSKMHVEQPIDAKVKRESYNINKETISKPRYSVQPNSAQLANMQTPSSNPNINMNMTNNNIPSINQNLNQEPANNQNQSDKDDNESIFANLDEDNELTPNDDAAEDNTHSA